MSEKYLQSNSTPAYFFDKLIDIKPEDIKNMGGKAIGLDVDNTIAIDSAFSLMPGVYDWFRTMKKAGFPVMIITNTNIPRAKYFSKLLDGIPYVGSCKKPAPAGFLKAAETMGVKINELVMIGDQLFTDIQGANNAGAISVRVRYTKREILLAVRYRLLRRKENRYLVSKGLGDKI